jgi:transposase
LARCRPATHRDPTTAAVLTAAKALACRIEFLQRQEDDLTAQLDVLVTQSNPALRAAYGIGPDTAAQLLVTAGANPHRLRSEASFAALCGAAPVPASSGKITRHRLSRGGDRAANNALYRIALVRMSAHPRTRDYVQRQDANGRTKKEILRLLRRAIAREVFRLLTRPGPIDDYRDLRPARQAKNLTLATKLRTRVLAYVGRDAHSRLGRPATPRIATRVDQLRHTTDRTGPTCSTPPVLVYEGRCAH